MYNLYTKLVKILEICKQFSENLVNESGNVPTFLISYQGDSSMTAGRKLQACVRNCAKGLPWKWMVERNNSLLTPSQ